MEITVEKLEEGGFKAAMRGLALNKNQGVDEMPGVGLKLAPLDYGHNKFLEHLVVWVLVRAPRYWWQDADTYRLSSKQSESTNHTIMRRALEGADFEDSEIRPDQLAYCNSLIAAGSFVKLKKHLPEGFMQTREWRFDYKCLSNMIVQRQYHKLPHWPKMLVDLYSQLEHPEFLRMRFTRKELNIDNIPV